MRAIQSSDSVGCCFGRDEDRGYNGLPAVPLRGWFSECNARRWAAHTDATQLESPPARNLVLLACASPILGSITTIPGSLDRWAAVGYQLSPSLQAETELWNGGQWHAVPTPAVDGSLLQSVTAVSADDVWAVGGSGAETRTPRALIENWNGTNWKAVASPRVGATSQFYEVVNGAVETCHTSTEYGPPSRLYHQVWFSASQQHQRAMRWRSESQRLTRGAPLSNIGAAIDGRLFRVPILLRMVMTGSTPYRPRTPPMFWAVGWNDSPYNTLTMHLVDVNGTWCRLPPGLFSVVLALS